MSDISYLPENLRGTEASVQKQKSATPPVDGPVLKMHIPASTADEDIEIIEVDESELGAILADEPFFTRLSYQLSVAFDTLKQKLTKQSAAPPAKLPPQFFSPPKSGLVTAPGRAGAVGGDATKSRARITPLGDAPRRVRVIRRVRKPVRVSLLSAEELLAYQVNVPNRQWTLAVSAVLFMLVIGGGYWLLTVRVQDAAAQLASFNQELEATRAEIRTKETMWSTYRDLERRLTTLNGLLNSHRVMTRALDFLEKVTLPQVYYQSATMSPEGLISLDVVADSFETAAKQLITLERHPAVKSAEALSFSASGGEISTAPAARAPASPAASRASQATTVGFQLIVQIDPSILRGPLNQDLAFPTATTTVPVPSS
jgi:Tfp pilus assembly protein PilN